MNTLIELLLGPLGTWMIYGISALLIILALLVGNYRKTGLTTLFLVMANLTADMMAEAELANSGKSLPDQYFSPWIILAMIVITAFHYLRERRALAKDKLSTEKEVL